LIEFKTTKNRSTVNIALISIFSALWVVLNLTIAPLGFAVFHLPVIHSLIIFFMVILVIWATNQYGAASAVSIIGSAIVLLAGGPLPVLGFVPAALLFDLVLLVNHHEVNLKPINIAIVVLASAVCAYIAAVVNGILILSLALTFVLTIWAGWNLLGGIIAVVITLPIIGILEKAQVKKVQTD
jgi:hypothetical protein